jgi:hypothetical protein
MQTTTHITFFHHKNFNKTLKHNNDRVRALSMSKKNNKENHHYLMETASSLNKKTNKYENTNHKPMNSCTTMYQKSPSQIHSRQRSMSQTKSPSLNGSISQSSSQLRQQSFLKKSYNWESNDNIQFSDKLNHFEVDTDFGNDPFGHFS